jgi:hypothetical protein
VYDVLCSVQAVRPHTGAVCCVCCVPSSVHHFVRAHTHEAVWCVWVAPQCAGCVLTQGSSVCWVCGVPCSVQALSPHVGATCCVCGAPCSVQHLLLLKHGCTGAFAGASKEGTIVLRHDLAGLIKVGSITVALAPSSPVARTTVAVHTLLCLLRHATMTHSINMLLSKPSAVRAACTDTTLPHLDSHKLPVQRCIVRFDPVSVGSLPRFNILRPFLASLQAATKHRKDFWASIVYDRAHPVACATDLLNLSAAFHLLARRPAGRPAGRACLHTAPGRRRQRSSKALCL